MPIGEAADPGSNPGGPYYALSSGPQVKLSVAPQNNQNKNTQGPPILIKIVLFNDFIFYYGLQEEILHLRLILSFGSTVVGKGKKAGGNPEGDEGEGRMGKQCGCFGAMLVFLRSFPLCAHTAPGKGLWGTLVFLGFVLFYFLVHQAVLGADS